MTAIMNATTAMIMIDITVEAEVVIEILRDGDRMSVDLTIADRKNLVNEAEVAVKTDLSEVL